MQQLKPGLKQFRSDGCLSYLLWDRDQKVGALIDPHLSLVADYRTFLGENGLKLTHVFETHTHADHFSASHLIKKEFGGKIFMSEKTKSRRHEAGLKDGEKIQIGRLVLESWHTPGHTPDSMCLIGEGLAFTGDTLLIGSTGRTDFDGADPREQWTSLQRLLQLPELTVVLPAHDYSNLLFSTIEAEKQRNPHLLMPSMDAFVELKIAESIPNPTDEVRKRLEFNMMDFPGGDASSAAGGETKCGIPLAGESRVATISVEKYANKLKKGSPAGPDLFLDVRERDEYEEGHMPGAAHLALSELSLHLSELKNAEKIYVSCLSGARSQMAAKTLEYVGLNGVINVTGGFQAWRLAGLPVEATQKNP